MTTIVEQHGPERPLPAAPPFILYLDGAEYAEEMHALAVWVGDLLLPVYGREVTSQQPWCPRWWEHLEAVARLHALWLAWQELTDPMAGASGPAVWHRDHLGPVLAELRSPVGPFAGCKAGAHRAKQPPAVEPYGTET
ncbi:DUF4913 domain-containing protein [Streptomyces europaeiscabiei]|uniref:DUF4913 domain-containing protein n=1 Tax=Streptomyces europaeiscabiei TaxID=146819 RepID=A0ABU4NXT5_9ACTN|nr:DUF4913 domain-containing protein [Streptomyces europaeiscabiei]MDX2531117.1 DUF4913 domain-containing protein [Streptomyces europaeiscabiei]MDX2765911.1 DUF4913 domain-containing protein [Streptomyces europaeiscabiei]MDX2772498.1 DUF4913 domain-containing protein [Streptomyces europaeiscabiei]MDX3548608.1 DUF4913 domain-containing protein [Streptomyces europaeiscabiei]MDX3558021.1 DUF4913 domain-containing protein [Streptomyces europaeiscabiei]